jgi:ribosomal protein S11
LQLTDEFEKKKESHAKVQQENTSVHQDDHHPAELVERSLGTIKFTKTITKRTLFVHQENFCLYMLLNLEILEPKFENG